MGKGNQSPVWLWRDYHGILNKDKENIGSTDIVNNHILEYGRVT